MQAASTPRTLASRIAPMINARQQSVNPQFSQSVHRASPFQTRLPSTPRATPLLPLFRVAGIGSDPMSPPRPRTGGGAYPGAGASSRLPHGYLQAAPSAEIPMPTSPRRPHPSPNHTFLLERTQSSGHSLRVTPLAPCQIWPRWTTPRHARATPDPLRTRRRHHPTRHPAPPLSLAGEGVG